MQFQRCAATVKSGTLPCCESRAGECMIHTHYNHFYRPLLLDFPRAVDSAFGPSKQTRYLMGAMPGMAFGGFAPGVGPMGIEGGSASGWRGDHSFNHGAVMYALMNFVEPEVAQRHPDWTSQHIRAEARQVMTLRLSENRTFANKERNREQEMSKRWEVTETSPGTLELTTTQAGEAVTLRELWEHTKEYAEKKGIPSAYNPEEERAQLAMQDAFIAGGTSVFISVLSHPDEIRYAQVWQKEDDGSIIAKTIDVGAVAGRGMSTEEASDLVQHLASFYSNTGKEIETASAEYPHVMVRQGNADVEDVKIIARARVDSVSDRSSMQDMHIKPRMNDADARVGAIYAATAAVEHSLHVASQDVTRSVRELHAYSKTRMKKRIQNKTDASVPPFLQLLHPEIFHQEAALLKEKQKGVRPSALMNSEPTAKEQVVVSEEPMLFSTSVSITQEEQEIQDIVERQAGETFLITEDTMVLSEQEQEVVFSLFIPAAEIPREQAEKGKEKISPAVIDRETLAKTIEFVQKIDALPVSEQKQMIVEEKKHIIKQILLLWEIVGETARSEGKTNAQSAHSETRTLNALQENKTENTPEGKLTFALAAWMLLKLTQYYVSLDALEAIVDKKEGVSLAASIQKEKPKNLIQKETGQWILLSIIWYLAQIREQGFVQQQAAPKKKKKKHTPVVIFAYGS